MTRRAIVALALLASCVLIQGAGWLSGPRFGPGIGPGFTPMVRGVAESSGTTPHWQQRPSGLVAYWHYEDGFTPYSAGNPAKWVDQIHGYVASFPNETGAPTLATDGIKINPFGGNQQSSYFKLPVTQVENDFPFTNATRTVFVHYVWNGVTDGDKNLGVLFWGSHWNNMFGFAPKKGPWNLATQPATLYAGGINNFTIGTTTAQLPLNLSVTYGNNELYAYQNAIQTTFATGTLATTKTGYIWIGTSYPTGSGYWVDWQGRIQEIGIYNRVLTAEEIVQVSQRLP